VDVAATLAAWGRWQAALAPGRGPSVVDALVGSLGGLGAQQRARPAVFSCVHAGWTPLVVGVFFLWVTDAASGAWGPELVLLCVCHIPVFVFLTSVFLTSRYAIALFGR